MDAEYKALRDAIEQQGVHTTLRKVDDVLQLICAAESTDSGLAGNSFWLGRDGQGRWYLATWTSRFWTVPAHTDPPTLSKLCREFIGLSRTPIYALSDELARRHGLMETDGPFEE